MNSVLLDRKPPSKRHWLRQLQPLELPVNPAVRSVAVNKLLSRSGNAANVAGILLTDPALVLRLVHTANQQLAPSGNALKSLAHAISLLGVPATEQLLRDAPEYDRETFPYLDEYRRQLGISLHAAFQLRGWSRHQPHWADDDLFLATLLQRAPIWVLWHQAPESMIALQEAQLKQRGSRHDMIEKRILGCGMQPLAATLSRQWHLPTPAQTSWYPGERGNARQWILLSRIIPEQARPALEQFPELQRLAGSDSLAVALANRLAEEADWNWYSRRTLRLQHILAVSLCTTLPQAIALTHQQAAEASRGYRLANLFSPAVQLLGGYRREQVAARPPSHETSSDAAGASGRNPSKRETPEPPENTEPARDDSLPEPLAAFIEQLHRQPHIFNDLHDLFNRVVNALCRDLGFERATTSLLIAKQRQLRTYYSSGCDNSPQLKGFSHPLQRGDLFNKLLQRPLSVRLQRDNYAQIWRLLPGPFKQACGVDQLVMMSIFVNNRPLALLYADCGNTNGAISDVQYAHFKRLCYAVSDCLSQRSTRKM